MRNGHTTKHPATHRTISARDVSVYILSKLAQDRKLETVKLQRLLWFCQGWHYGAYNTPLFAEDFEAWTLGPVVPAIHHRHPGVHEVSANHTTSAATQTDSPTPTKKSSMPSSPPTAA